MIKRCRVDQEILVFRSLGEAEIEEEPRKFFGY